MSDAGLTYEVAHYVRMGLPQGIAADGRRGFSAENLESSWAPGLEVSNLYGGPPPLPHAWDKDR
jgi:hypothetical protein